MPGLVVAQVVAWTKTAARTLRHIEEDNDLGNAENLPSAFQEVYKRLPAVYTALDTSWKEIQRKEDDNVAAEIKSTAEACNNKAGRLETLFFKVVHSPAVERKERYRDAVRELGKDSRVESLMKGIIDDARLVLTVDKDIEAKAKEDLQALVEASKEVSAIPPSLQDESGAPSINNYGSGFQNVSTGDGTQNNNNASGQQFIGGTFHGVNPFQKPA